nr:MAG TPA: hypothetical protein [Caudoviricetes sp.]
MKEKVFIFRDFIRDAKKILRLMCINLLLAQLCLLKMS